MVRFPIFLTIVVVVRNNSSYMKEIFTEITNTVRSFVSNYEIIIVDNASDDESLSILKNLVGENGFPNVHVYALIKEVEIEIASLIGLETALGDFVVFADPLTDAADLLPRMIDDSVSGFDMVFATNKEKNPRSIFYQILQHIFNQVYKWASGISLAEESTQYRILSRRLVNFILQHPQPEITYRNLPAIRGFTRKNFHYKLPIKRTHEKRLFDSIKRSMRLFVLTNKAPMRIITGLSLCGAMTNCLYSIYVVGVALLKKEVAPGWISLSLQQSGMFFLISIVLLMLGEYISYVLQQMNQGPKYYIGQEFSSAYIAQYGKLNVEEAISRPNSV